MDKALSEDRLDHSLKVLFVDDAPDQRILYERIFEGRCEIEIVESASEAKNVLASDHENIAVIVSDMCMPEESGIDLLKHVRQAYPDMIRILVSAYAGDDVRSSLSAINECAVHKYLEKPVGMEQLRDEVKQAIEIFLQNTISTHKAHTSVTIFEDFKEACDRWTLHNVDLSQELRALDYGLCGILSVYRNMAASLFSEEEAKEVRLRMEDYVDDIMSSSMLFSQTDTRGEFILNRSSDYKH